MKYLILIFNLFLTSSVLLGQILGLCNNDTLIVENNTVLFVKGDFVNEHEVFENDGEFTLHGNLENKIDILNEGTGTLILNGPNTQDLILSGEFKTFNLEIDNEDDAIFFGNKSVSVFGDLDFTSGIFWTRNNNLINFKQNALHFGANDFSHINGPVIKEGNTTFRYPIGKEGKLRPLEVRETNNLNGYQAEYFFDTHPLRDIDTSLQTVSDIEYWSFDKIYGPEEPQITLVWDFESFINTQSDDLQIGYTDGIIDWKRIESSTELPEQLPMDLTSINPISYYGFFTFASTNGNTLLQDGLTDFELIKTGCNVRINWNTVERSGLVDSYSIERQGSGESFEEIANIDADNSFMLEDYSHLDNDVENETIYFYRVTVNYKDGRTVSSEPKFIKANCHPISFTLYPNPVFADGFLTLGVSSEIDKDLEVHVVDVLGRILQSKTLEIRKGNSEFEITNLVHYGVAEYFLWTPEDDTIPTLEFQVIR